MIEMIDKQSDRIASDFARSVWQVVRLSELEHIVRPFPVQTLARFCASKRSS